MRHSGYLLLLPLMIILVGIELVPLGFTFFLSVTNYGQGGTFVGAANYASMFADSNFWQAAFTSLLFASGSTILAILIGLGLAYLLTNAHRGKVALEAIFLMPLAVAPIVAGVVWAPSAVWDDINTVIHFVLRLPYLDLTTYGVYFPIMTLSDAWEWAPMLMLVSLSVLSSIPKEVIEAAEVEGASSWTAFRRIGFPTIMRSPVTQFVIIIRFVDALRSFEIPFTWSTWLSFPNTGSPVDTLSLLLFKLLFTPSSSLGFVPISYISAVAVFLLVMTVSATTVLLVLLKRLGRF